MTSMQSARKWLPVLALLLLCSCTGPVTRKEARSFVPSFDGNAQDSGVKAVVPEGFLISEAAKVRYDLLVGKYGAKELPPVVVGDGLTRTNGGWVIDREHMVKWGVFASKDRQAPLPAPP